MVHIARKVKVGMTFLTLLRKVNERHRIFNLFRSMYITKSHPLSSHFH